MVQIHQFTFSPFQENTYVLYNSSKQCWIIDPGCYFDEEKRMLKDFILSNNLKPERLLLTHCHLDHVFGCSFVQSEFGVLPEYHLADEPTLELAPVSAKLYGVNGFEAVPESSLRIDVSRILSLGEDEFEVRFCPGHSPGHVVLVQKNQKFVIGGDVLFRESIGRTDLPGGNHAQLIKSIEQQLFTLPDDFVVYSGHGPKTSIGHEKRCNPFLAN